MISVSKQIVSQIEQGDGRVTIRPPAGAIGRNPMRMSISNARAVIADFRRNNGSNHSANGGTLWVVVAFCEAFNIRYQITVYEFGCSVLQLSEKV